MKNELRVPVERLGNCEYLPSTSEIWLESVMSTFRRAKTLVAGPMMFDFFCSEISLILVWIFEVNHLVWLWESHPLLFPVSISVFHPVPGDGGIIMLEVYRSGRKKTVPEFPNDRILFSSVIEHCTPCLHGIYFYFHLSAFYQAVYFFIMRMDYFIIKTKNSYKMTGNTLTLFILILP